MKYKGIIFDLDGTAMPNRRDGMPSQYLVDAIDKIKDKIYVSAATGRGIVLSRGIFKKLGLTAPCIISGGTKIVDPVTEKILWEKKLSMEQTKEIIETAKKFPYSIYLGDGAAHISPKDVVIKEPRNIIYIEPTRLEDTNKILAELAKIPDIVAHPVMSWTDGHFDIHITHKEATKKHSIEVLFQMLGLKSEEVIGFGDSDNDLPIFEMVGMKVAMENGSENLKKTADLIAPPADQDGVAKMLEKLIML